MAGHLEHDVEAFHHAQLLLDVVEVGLGRIDRTCRAHLLGERPPEGDRSETTTWRAPACRTTGIVMSPGPAPEMRTSSPWTSNARAVWTAFPNGSKIAATSSSTPGQ